MDNLSIKYAYLGFIVLAHLCILNKLEKISAKILFGNNHIIPFITF